MFLCSAKAVKATKSSLPATTWDCGCARGDLWSWSSLSACWVGYLQSRATCLHPGATALPLPEYLSLGRRNPIFMGSEKVDGCVGYWVSRPGAAELQRYSPGPYCSTTWSLCSRNTGWHPGNFGVVFWLSSWGQVPQCSPWWRSLDCRGCLEEEARRSEAHACCCGGGQSWLEADACLLCCSLLEQECWETSLLEVHSIQGFSSHWDWACSFLAPAWEQVGTLSSPWEGFGWWGFPFTPFFLSLGHHSKPKNRLAALCRPRYHCCVPRRTLSLGALPKGLGTQWRGQMCTIVEGDSNFLWPGADSRQTP